jgi:phosphonate transport system permease protein
VGAGGIGDALHTAISLFHMRDLTLLLITMLALVAVVDALGDRLRARILSSSGTTQAPSLACDPQFILQPKESAP